jgi:HPt (histidine-containing phosphotransfer) domain-containing protein
MSDTALTVTISRELEDLIPGFMKNRRSEVDALRTALKSGDFDKLHQLGHRMKGVGKSYGFARITAVGIAIEEAARGRIEASLEALISEYAEYLDKVTIEYE